jgi:hypothetical protein
MTAVMSFTAFSHDFYVLSKGSKGTQVALCPVITTERTQERVSILRPSYALMTGAEN